MENWFKKHVDTVFIIGSILSSMIWINSKFNDIEKDIAIIKTVLMMKDIMPRDLAVKNDRNNQ
jgi:hypothetical protein